VRKGLLALIAAPKHRLSAALNSAVMEGFVVVRAMWRMDLCAAISEGMCDREVEAAEVHGNACMATAALGCKVKHVEGET